MTEDASHDVSLGRFRRWIRRIHHKLPMKYVEDAFAALYKVTTEVREEWAVLDQSHVDFDALSVGSNELEARNMSRPTWTLPLFLV